MAYRRFGIIFLTIALPFFAFSSLYIKEEQLVSNFREGLQDMLSKRLHTDVRIGEMRGGVFKKTVLEDINVRLKDYELNLEKAELGYSLWDIASGKGPIDKGVSDIIKLENGSLKFNNLMVLSGIRGRIRLKQDRLILHDLKFNLPHFSEGSIKGDIFKKADGANLNLALTVTPISGKNAIAVSRSVINIKGPLDGLVIDAEATTAAGGRLFFRGGLIVEEAQADASFEIYFKDRNGRMTPPLPVELQLDTARRVLRAAFIPRQGVITVNGDYSAWPVITADIRNEHLRLRDIDISNIIHIFLRPAFKSGRLSHIVVDASTDSTIVNFKPFEELEGSFSIDEDIIKVDRLKIGKKIAATGALSLKGTPKRLFLKAEISDFDISQLCFFCDEIRADAISGRISGGISIEGPIDALGSRASLHAEEGNLGTVVYSRLLLNLEGTGPILRIYDSRIIREDSFLTLEGYIDLRRLNSERFLDNLTIGTDPNTIIWEGWDISKTSDNKVFNFGRDVGKNLKVGFKKYMSDETIYQPADPQDELEVEYKAPDKNSSLQFKAKENEEFLGIVKKQKF